MHVKKIEKAFYGFLFPKYSVSEILLASLLMSLALILNFKNRIFPFDDADFAIFGVMVAIISVLLLRSAFVKIFLHKNTDRNLAILQFFGLLIILIISFFYSLNILKIYYNQKDIALIDYLGVFWAAITVLRCLIIYTMFRFVRDKEAKKYMPVAEYNNYNPFYVLVAIIITIIIFFQDTDNLAISLGRSFYLGVILFEIINLLKFKHKSIK